MEDARAALFRPHLNTAFVLRPAGGAAVPLVLRSVTEPPVHNRVEQFSLMFHAPAGLAVTDGIHALRHATLGDFDLFIVQVGGSKGRRVAYEACFSRHVSATEGPCPRRS